MTVRLRLAVLLTTALLALVVLIPAGAAASAPPPLAVNAAALTELTTGQLLYKNRAFSRLPIASTTKLMTALITLEHVKHLGRIFTQNDFYASSADSQIGLVPGERMSVHDLLLALLLPSADDAAEDLAYNVGHGSVARFVGMMNARARQLGLTRTHYSTPSGLDTPGNYSTATDLLTLARYLLLHQPWFARAVALPHAVLKTGSHPRYVANRNDLVGRYSWVRGVKTGHTSGAGYVLVGAGERRGMELLSVVMGTSSEYERDANTLRLLSWGLGAFRIATPVTAGQVIARPTVKDRSGVHATVIAENSVVKIVPRSPGLSLAGQRSQTTCWTVAAPCGRRRTHRFAGQTGRRPRPPPPCPEAARRQSVDEGGEVPHPTVYACSARRPPTCRSGFGRRVAGTG